MANKITHKQSSVAGKVPTTAQLQLGELAINTTDGKLFLKKNMSGTESVINIGSFVAMPDKPTTLAGYGITDAVTSSHVGSGGTAHGAATTSAAGFMSAADKTKLDGVAAGATAYIHPATHPASIITQDASNRFVTDAEKAAWNAKEAGGTAAAAMTAHTGATDPHTQYLPKAGGTMTGAISFSAGQTWPTFNQSTTGNAATATKLATPRMLTIGSTGKTFDGSGALTWTLAEIGGVGLQYLTEVRNTTAPNATVPVHGLQSTGTDTNIDLVLGSKGTGAIVARIPDSTATGGNKRGTNAVDLQVVRSSADQVASGFNSTISGGRINTASGSNSTISGGSINTASGSNSTISGGQFNTASGSSSTISGGSSATTNGLTGLWAYGFYGVVSGQHQMAFWGGGKDTAGATSVRLTADAGTASATNQLALRNNSVFRVRGTVVARNTSTNGCKEWTFDALIKRGASAAATAIVGTPSITSTFADAEAASWAIALSADTTNGALAVTATGAASTTIRWTAVVHSIEVA